MRVEIKLNTFILDASERSGSSLSPLIQGQEPAVPIDYKAGWDQRDALHVMEKMENEYLAPARNTNPSPSSP